ncbi:MAG: class II aldolase/adducin family protein [Syntrophorhabdaceae bacterium]|nr:class II aldolase/adducin family protein [Syntrophorhabdaceae bacterium]
MRHRIILSVLLILVLASGVTPAMADVKVATGEITKVEGGGKAVTIKTDSGQTIVSKMRAKRTEVFQGDKLISFKDMRKGDRVWLTYRPGGKNEAGVIKVNPDLKSETELVKDKIARAVRILNMEGLVAFSGHISARIPGGKTFFIHSYNQARGEVKPSDLCEVTLDGKQLNEKSEVPDETAIHAAVYRAREDVNAVIHIHPHYIIIPSIIGKDLIPVCGHGTIFGTKVPVYPDSEKIGTTEAANKMVKSLGKERAIVLRGHGAVLGEATIEAVVTSAFYMEENAKLLVDSYIMGTPIPMAEEEIKRAAENTFQPFSTKKTWKYYIDKGRKAGIFWDK